VPVGTIKTEYTEQNTVYRTDATYAISFTPTHNSRQNYSFIYFNIYILR